VIERTIIKLAGPDGSTEDCGLEFEVAAHTVVMKSTSGGTGKAIWHGNDAFHALELFRRKIEPQGYRALCNGSRRDAYPSGMCRDMGRGFMLYPIPPDGLPDLKTFDPAAVELIGTVEEQLSNWKEWIEDVQDGRPKPKLSLWDKLKGKK
jgi:hypothetical protein